jgi:hypothetical protein
MENKVKSMKTITVFYYFKGGIREGKQQHEPPAVAQEFTGKCIA